MLREKKVWRLQAVTSLEKSRVSKRTEEKRAIASRLKHNNNYIVSKMEENEILP